MDRYLSDPIPLSDAVGSAQFSAAELIFYDVDHSGDSFQALVFLNAPNADLGTPLEHEAGFAGSFVIFGHGGCFGDEGHCEVPTAAKDPFDNRPLHPLTPQTKLVDVGDALKRAAKEGDHLSVTVLAVVPGGDGPRLRDLLHFSAMRLVTYD
jgi:tyrosinase